MIRVDDDGDVRTVTLSRPERRNAVTPAGLEALADVVTDAETPVVHLRGAGEAFCAGADRSVVADLAAAVDDGDGASDAGDAVESFVRRGQATADAIADAEAVVVAGVDGPARGGGVELALACDVRVATPEATFAEPGVGFGLFGAWGGTARLPEVVGLGEAMDLSLSGRVIDAETARRMGLVSRVVDRPAAVAAELADNDPAAMRRLKRRLRDRRPAAAQADADVEAFEELVAANAADLRDLDN
ncbi:enoyl-CoA hydratase/isomerase family protein [Halobacteriales archaeon QS_8_69_73]|nr:MAG: enoyl-CoA hydratase/isomerase family protein [Halobacteriales archaeon QS_8_69_73]